MIIRRATRADKPFLDRLYTELEHDAVMYQPEHFVMSEVSRLTDEMFDSDAQTILVAEENGEVIGFAHVMLLRAKAISCLKPQTGVYIQDMVVTSGCRSRGTGTLLMDAVKEYGKDNYADFVRTQVFPMNEQGMRFYVKNGFSEKMITIEFPLK